MKWNETILEGSYRYVLPFHLSQSKKELAVIQINPSKANGKRLDPTAGKVKKLAEEKEYGSLYLFNFFAVISPKQEEIVDHGYEWIVGPKNDLFISEIPITSDIVIATGEPQGFLKKYYKRRKKELIEILKNRPVMKVGRLTEKGYPRHGRSWNQNDRELGPYDWK